jgi:hypothetical protein
MIAFPDSDSGVPCCLRRAIGRRHGSESSSYLHVWSQLLDLFGRDRQFRAGILLEIIGQKPFNGIPSFNLCAVLINVVNIVGIESDERFCVSLIISLFVFLSIGIRCLTSRGRLILLLASRLLSRCARIRRNAGQSQRERHQDSCQWQFCCFHSFAINCAPNFSGLHAISANHLSPSEDLADVVRRASTAHQTANASTGWIFKASGIHLSCQ